MRQPDAEKNCGFLGFDSHTAALTTLISLTGNENGGLISADKLGVDVKDGKMLCTWRESRCIGPREASLR